MMDSNQYAWTVEVSIAKWQVRFHSLLVNMENSRSLYKELKTTTQIHLSIWLELASEATISWDISVKIKENPLRAWSPLLLQSMSDKWYAICPSSTKTSLSKDISKKSSLNINRWTSGVKLDSLTYKRSKKQEN